MAPAYNKQSITENVTQHPVLTVTYCFILCIVYTVAACITFMFENKVVDPSI